MSDDDYPIPLLIGLRRDWTPRVPVLLPDYRAAEQRALARERASLPTRGRRLKNDPLDALLFSAGGGAAE